METKGFFNSAVALLGPFISYLIGDWNMIIKILATLIAIDYVTGVMKGSKNKEIASDIGFNGILRKAAIFIVVILAHLMDVATNMADPVFRTMVIYFYIGNEGISILENISYLGVDMPVFLIERFKKMKKENDKVGDLNE